MQSNHFFSLEQIIDRQPLTVTPDTLLAKTIGLMQQRGNSCKVKSSDDTAVNSSCVLIVKNNRLLGIFTERDLVKLIATETNLIGMKTENVMSKDIVALTYTGAEDIFAALNLLRSHHIRHLPIVDPDNNVLGLTTVKNLRRQLQPVNMMRWRKVAEVMQTEVIYARPEDSVRQVARLMTENKVSCVAICQTISQTDLLHPVGIITERDIVQFQNLNLDLGQPAREVMSTPLLLVSPQDTLWSVHQQMQQHRVRRLLVGGESGELVGIVTQTSLLQVFDPGEMYGLIESLQQQVCQLELAQTQLLENRQVELETEVEERTTALRIANEQRRAIAEFSQYALVTTELPSILQRAVYLVADTLEVEYSKVLKLLPDDTLLLEAGVGWQDGLVGTARLGIEHSSQAGYTLQQSQPVVVEDLRTETRFNGPQLLREHRVISGISVIIAEKNQPYGVLSAHTSQYRLFSPDDVNFLSAIANIIAQAQERQQAESALSNREQLYRSLVASVPVGIFQTNTKGNCLYVNQKWQKITGVSFSEALGTGWSKTLHPEDRDRVYSQWYEATRAKREFSLEYRFAKDGGEIVWVSGQAVPLYDDIGTVTGYLGTVTDISDRKRREAILKDIASGMSIDVGYNFLPSLVEYLSKTLQVDYAYMGKLVRSTDSIQTQAVYSKGKIVDNFEYGLVGTPCRNVVKQQLCVYPEAVQQLFPDSILLPKMLAESFGGMPIYSSDGKVLGLICVVDSKPFTDVPLIEEVLKIFANRVATELERQQAELKLRQSEQKFKAIFNQTFQFIGLLEPDGKLIEANKTALDFIGLRLSDVAGKYFWQTPWWASSTENQNLLKQAIKKAARGEFVRFEADHPGTDNRTVTVDFSLSPVKDESGKVIMLIPEGRNISNLKQAEAKNREQAALLDVATDAIMVRGLDDKILYWNRGAEKMYGWTKAEALNQNGYELLYREYPTELNKIQQIVIERGEWQGEINQVTKAGKDIVVQSRWTLVRDKAGNPSSYLVVKNDITEQKQLEAQFLRTQRLESLGTLAGGIAHDLNNILAPILGFAKLLPLKLPDVDEQTKSFFKIMETNAQRGTALVKQILTFSQGLEGNKGVVQVRHVINEIGQIVTETFPKSIELKIDVPKTLWTVNADPNQLHQVLMNLCVNARDAMPDGGQLNIEAGNFTIDREYARLHLDAELGSYVKITVADTGVGIPPEIIDRIFEPFFTTKEIGRGTGLGLSTVIGIIKSHGGFIEVASKTTGKRGTRVNIFIPASDTTTSTAEEEKSIPQGNGELILIVDDESSILEVTKATLEIYNYRVLTASNGIEAVATYANNKEAIDLVIMDIMMPGMDGKTAIRTLKQIDSQVKVVAVSGLISSHEIIHELDNEVVVFLSKPYTNEELLETVSEVVSN